MDAYDVPRCKSCGDALLVTDPDASSIICRSCGNMNIKSDAMEACEQVKVEVMSWIRKAIPQGINISQTEMMDPVARHNIFVTNIKPNVDTEFRSYRFGFINLMSNQLIAMPYRSLDFLKTKHDARDLFTFDAKIKHIESMAVADESKDLLKNASGLTFAYAMLLNNAKFLAENTDGRYRFMAKNFKEAAESLGGLSEYDIIRERFEALSIVSEGIADLLENKCIIAAGKLQNGLDMLNEVRAKTSSNLDFGSMGMAVSKEIVVCTTIHSMAEAINRSPELEPAEVLHATANIINELDREEKSASGQWDVQLKRPERYTDIFSEFAKVLGSKTGTQKIKVAKGNGDISVPFWILEIKYSFVTGGLKKKSVEVVEQVLLSAMFTTSAESMKDPRAGMTDIFSSRPEGKFLDGFKGKETSISMGGGVKALIDSSLEGFSNASKIVTPVSTKQEAEVKCNDYLSACQSTYAKLRMGKSVAKGLIFLPCKIEGSKITVVSDLGTVTPLKIGDADTITRMAI